MKVQEWSFAHGEAGKGREELNHTKQGLSFRLYPHAAAVKRSTQGTFCNKAFHAPSLQTGQESNPAGILGSP